MGRFPRGGSSPLGRIGDPRTGPSDTYFRDHPDGPTASSGIRLPALRSLTPTSIDGAKTVCPIAQRSWPGTDGLGRVPTIEHMTIQRMDHVGIVVDDLADAVAFFVELGLELQGEAPVEGDWVDRIVGLEGVRAQIAMLRTPDGHVGLELTKFHTPSTDGGFQRAPANASGIRHIAFAVEDIDAVLARLQARGAEPSASWGATGTATGSAMSAAPRGSSSSWRSRSAEQKMTRPRAA